MLGKGLHFWFECFDEYRGLFTSTTDGADFLDICEILSDLSRIQSAQDSYKLTIEALECGMRDELNPNQDPEFNIAFR